MRRTRASSLAPHLAALVATAVALALPARADDLALKRVMLSTGGIGYFEYEAQVTGPVTLGLDVPLGLVDDVLQSLVVFDAAGGVGGVELPGQDAGHAAFADVPFGPQALGSALDYLNSLQGVTLDVKGPRPMVGRLLRAERVREPAAGAPPPEAGVTHTRVSVLTASGLQQFVLEEADSVQVADGALRDRIDRALEAIRGQAAHDARHLSLRSSGAGARTVRVGYVAGAPLWKATYRLMLPADGSATARLQGWAVLENQSGADWNGVDLALQYGNPVTFRQALYRAYYVQRPEVPIEVLGRILPTVDTRARVLDAPASGMPAPARAPMRAPMRAMAKAAPAADAAAPAPEMAAPEQQAAASEAAEATVFRLASPVVLPAGHSAAVPILDRDVPGQRIGVVQEGRAHPLQALRLVNDSDTSLPAGVLTIYDPQDVATFAGDARLGGLPKGESRLLEFAEDLRTGVTWHTDEGTTLVAVTASQGVLHLTQRQRWTARITLTGPAGDARSLLVEVPRHDDGTLLVEGDIKPSEATATEWRLPVALQAGETRTLVVHVDRLDREEMTLLDDSDALVSVLNEQALTPTAKAALKHIVDLRAALSSREAERERLKAQVAEVERDEQRLRQNLSALPASDALHGKLIRALDADEERIATLAAAGTQAEAAATQARSTLEQVVMSLHLER